MPAQERVGFEDQQGVFPMLDATGEENKPKALGLGEVGHLNLTVDAQRDQLLTEQGVLGDESVFCACEVGGYGKRQRMMGGSD